METLSPLISILLAGATRRIPGLKRLPLFELVIAFEVLLLAKAHYDRLSQTDRHRLVAILRETGGDPRNLTPPRRRELLELLSKTDPQLFVTSAAEKLSPLSFRRRR